MCYHSHVSGILRLPDKFCFKKVDIFLWRTINNEGITQFIPLSDEKENQYGWLSQHSHVYRGSVRRVYYTQKKWKNVPLSFFLHCDIYSTDERVDESF